MLRRRASPSSFPTGRHQFLKPIELEGLHHVRIEASFVRALDVATPPYPVTAMIRPRNVLPVPSSVIVRSRRATS